MMASASSGQVNRGQAAVRLSAGSASKRAASHSRSPATCKNCTSCESRRPGAELTRLESCLCAAQASLVGAAMVARPASTASSTFCFMARACAFSASIVRAVSASMRSLICKGEGGRIRARAQQGLF